MMPISAVAGRLRLREQPVARDGHRRGNTQSKRRRKQCPARWIVSAGHQDVSKSIPNMR
jgi:hypothetical protein